MSKIFNHLFFQKHARLLIQLWAFLKKYPYVVLGICLSVSLLVISQLIACGATVFYHQNVACLDPPCNQNVTCSDDPRKLINGECEPHYKETEDNGRESAGTSWTQTVRPGRVDILFVIDNSSSMHEEHKNIATQFEDFLDDIRDFDYRIAMTTVDISSSPGNRQRRYQDGRLIEFDDGSLFLYNDEEEKRDRRKKHRKNKDMFIEAVVRDETRRCDIDDSDDCPTDERAICALNMALERDAARSEGAYNKFIRTSPDVHFMVVILSDEDERSSQEFIKEQSYARGSEEFEFEACDEPETFYVNVYNLISPLKSYSVHSIIIPPGDTRCYNQQISEDGSGAYGEIYAKIAQPYGRMMDRHPGLRDGKVISICDRSYTSQLGKLSNYLQMPLPITLPCANPSQVLVRMGREDIRHSVKGQTVVIEERIPLDEDLTISTECLNSS